MNNEEAVRLLKGEIDFATDFSWKCEAFEMAISSLDRAEKYKWHDLRKNPKDLPELSRRVLCARYDYVTGTVFYDLLWFENWTFWDRRIKAGDFAVIAWREIEPFEEKAC